MNNPPEEGRRTHRLKRRTFNTNKEVVSPKKNSSLINSPLQDYRKYIKSRCLMFQDFFPAENGNDVS